MKLKIHQMASKYVLVILLCLAASSYSCAQNPSEKHQLMNTEERIAHLEGKVKPCDQQPVYRLQIETANAYKVMINGFPIGNNFGNIATNLNVIINHALLESGNQQLKIQVHPPYHEDGTAQALSDQIGRAHV